MEDTQSIQIYSWRDSQFVDLEMKKSSTDLSLHSVVNDGTEVSGHGSTDFFSDDEDNEDDEVSFTIYKDQVTIYLLGEKWEGSESIAVKLRIRNIENLNEDETYSIVFQALML